MKMTEKECYEKEVDRAVERFEEEYKRYIVK